MWYDGITNDLGDIVIHNIGLVLTSTPAWLIIVLVIIAVGLAYEAKVMSDG